MANFKPLNNYALYILGKVIEKYNLRPPFIDIASGTGYLSEYLGNMGWRGKAIDFSEQAVDIAREKLKKYNGITVEQKAAEDEKGKYNTALMFDLLEHIKNDQQFLKKVHSLLNPNGYLVIAVPSNPQEWRWDDEFYGHYRRYTEGELREKLIKANFKPIIFYDYTFPFFWILRRIYTQIKKGNKKFTDKKKQTVASSLVYSWNFPLISSILDNTSLLWFPIYFIQYIFFKSNLTKGSAMMILAKK